MTFEPLRELGKLLLILGVVLAAVGAFLMLGSRLPWRLGRLPGDLIVKRENFTFYFPLVTSLLLSVIFSMLLWLFGRK